MQKWFIPGPYGGQQVIEMHIGDNIKGKVRHSCPTELFASYIKNVHSLSLPNMISYSHQWPMLSNPRDPSHLHIVFTINSVG